MSEGRSARERFSSFQQRKGAAREGRPPRGRAGGPSVNEEVEQAFERAVGEGEHRLSRTWPGLLATGLIGGIDVGVGVFALLIVHHATGSTLLSALAFSVGFIALTLGNSELFTENFLVPIAAVVAGKSEKMALVRLWGGTAAANLLGGWVLMALVIAAYPHLGKAAVEVAVFYPAQGIGRTSFVMALLGGTVITLMTWMERASPTVGGKLVAAVVAAFLLAAAPLNHAIVVSLDMFAALHIGAPFGYADWLGVLAWSSLGNLVGGLALVTMLRLVQVGWRKVEEERKRPKQSEDQHARDEAPTGAGRAPDESG